MLRNYHDPVQGGSSVTQSRHHHVKREIASDQSDPTLILCHCRQLVAFQAIG